MKMMRDQGLKIDVLDREGCARVEPALGLVKDRIAGAIHCPDDESGDCAKFTIGGSFWLASCGIRKCSTSWSR